MSAGITESDAKRAICDAIADGAIDIQLALRKHTTRGTTAHGKVLVRADVEIPARLEPQDVDFENSRPLRPWVVARERIPHLAGSWHVDWVELSRADVTKVLIPDGGGDQPSDARAPHERPPRPGRKSQPGCDAARRAIKALYPDGVPDQTTEPNAKLCKCVAAKLKELGLSSVSDDTMLRAAGRRQ
jgi:hypothetical protein